MPVRLEHLLRFSLSGFVLDYANLMRYFVMPRCRQVYLDTDGSRFDGVLELNITQSSLGFEVVPVPPTSDQTFKGVQL